MYCTFYILIIYILITVVVKIVYDTYVTYVKAKFKLKKINY